MTQLTPAPHLDRQALYTAVLALFAGITAADGSSIFRTAYTDSKHWEDVAPEDTPALCLDPVSEDAEARKTLPKVWRLRMRLLVYVHTSAQMAAGAGAQSPNALLNGILDAVEAAFVIDDIYNEACTLGGLVSHAAIEGTIERFSGVLGDEAAAAIPITILVSP